MFAKEVPFCLSYLFTLVVDVRSRMFQRGMDRGLTRGLVVGDDLAEVSYWQFVDGIILHLPKSKDNFLNVVSLLQIFESSFGFRIIPNKSGLVVSV